MELISKKELEALRNAEKETSFNTKEVKCMNCGNELETWYECSEHQKVFCYDCIKGIRRLLASGSISEEGVQCLKVKKTDCIYKKRRKDDYL